MNLFNRRTHVEEKIESFKYSVEVGHSKSGSEHILIIKSLKVKSNDVATLLEELKLALEDFRVIKTGE
tara:strand:- start:828 stop:1031 length:204 start_codon:yes stop_codon:yes gene_type:complete